MIVERTVLLVSAVGLSGGGEPGSLLLRETLGTSLLLIVIGDGFRGIPGFSKKNLGYVLTEAHTNTFCNVSIFERIESLNYL